MKIILEILGRKYVQMQDSEFVFRRGFACSKLLTVELTRPPI
jgi:hypothetical protein